MGSGRHAHHNGVVARSTLRAAFGWAFAERLIGCQPLEGFREPAQPDPRRDVPVDVVIVLLLAADDEVRLAGAGVKALAGVRRLYIAEQVALLLRSGRGHRRPARRAARASPERPDRSPAARRAGSVR